MGNWTDVYDWVLSVVGTPPTPYDTGQSYSTTWSPTEVLAYATACCIVIIVFKLVTYIIRRIFGGQ